jgi:ribokinase
MVRVVCAGHVNWDVTLRVDRLPEVDGEARIVEQRQGGGGSASNVAAVLAQLDVETRLLGSVGDDEHGLLVRRELDGLGVDTDLRVVADAATTVKYLVVDDDGEVLVLGNEGANEAVRPADVGATHLDAGDHLHLTSQRPDTARRLCELASEHGLATSFAPGRRLGDREYATVAERTDLLFLNGREIDAYCDDPATVAREREQILVVTRGDAGAWAYTPERTVEHAGFEVDAVDTTGAGDAFAAGFLAARCDGDDLAVRFDGDLRRALAVGNACGAVASRTMGARTHLDRSAVEAYLDR